jgi:hypothetical protein
LSRPTPFAAVGAALAAALRLVAGLGRRPRRVLPLAELRRRHFAEFEPEALAPILEALAEARGGPVGQLRPRDAAWRDEAQRDALRDALAAREVAVDLSSRRTVRDVVGAVVPLLERRPQAHR